MMKKGLFLVGDYSSYLKEFNFIQEFFKNLNIEIDLVDFRDISVLAEDDFNDKIYIKGKKIDLPDFVVVAAVSERHLYKLCSVVRMFETLNVNCINTVDSIVKAGDKIYSLQLAKQLVPEVKIPKTLLISPEVSLDIVEKEIGFPLVIKIMDGNQGNGVCLIETKEELDNILNIITASDYGQEIMVQEAILASKGRDIRVVVANGEVIHAFARYNDNDFKSNIHKGGSIDNFHAPDSLIDVSIKLATAFGLKMGSIDFLFGETEDEFYLCELNSVPGISYIFEAKKAGQADVIERFAKAAIKLTQ